nr:ABC transporter substrate-binding protein [uncultured Holophaga sp.]
MTGKLRRGRIWASLLLAVGLVVAGRSWQHQPIRIGFAAQLTGQQAELGRQERDGTLLAIEEANRRGGLGGRPLRLLVQDDAGQAERAAAVDRELIRQDVVAIIGHCTTTQTQAAMAVTEPAGMVLLGPTCSSPTLSGRDDHFFRVYPAFPESARHFARQVTRLNHGGRLGVLWDLDNASFTQPYAATFLEAYRGPGRGNAVQKPFSSRSRPDFNDLLQQLRSEGVAGLLIIASDADAALIAQRTRLMGWPVPLFAGAWAQTLTLLEQGGHAVEGMRLEQSYAPDARNPREQAFREAFERRFGHPPSFGAAFAYESAGILLAALARTQGSPRGLKEALLSIHDFPGLSGPITFDRYGDVQRPFYLTAVRGGRFVTLAPLEGPISPDGHP